jgi:hypothetical protein
MRKTIRLAAVYACFCAALGAQVTTGEILGVVRDASGASVANAQVKVRNLDTNDVRERASAADGAFRFPQLPVGNYEVTVEARGFSKYLQGPIVLRLNQDADLQIKLQVGGVTETVTVSTDAPLINTTNAEVGTNFDSKRISELPLAPNRNLMSLALSAAGVSQLSSGQTSFAASGNNGTENGIAFSVNGMRLRSNNFMIDGQDANSPSVGGSVQAINNPDIVAEFRLITNQFAAEYGRAAGSVVNIVTKSGSNTLHGSAFWFHNDNHLNSRSNLDKAARFAAAPFRIENQFGGTVGGPVIKDKTFFFGSLQRWTDRRLGSGSTINGVPTEEGRQLLNSLAGTRPSVKALLENLPAATAPIGRTAPASFGGRTVAVPLGSLTGATSQKFDDWQWSSRVDHRFNDRHSLGGRFLFDNYRVSGTGQATPVGLSSVTPQRTQSASAFLNSSISPTIFSELRASYSRVSNATNAADPTRALRIPSIEVNELGLTGFNAAASRTGIGLAVNLPQYQTLNNYQLQETVGILRGTHSMKFGLDFRRQEQFQSFLPTTRGRLQYNTLQTLIDDVANAATINAPLKGGEAIQYYRYYDYFFFAQDEWRAAKNFTLTYGIRYETPGNPMANLAYYNQRVVSAANGDQRFAFKPVPARDRNNWAPRLGFNYRIGQGPGVLGKLTGDGKLVLRGGYSRTYDAVFNNIALNIGSAFPFVNVFTLPASAPNAFTQIDQIRSNPLLIPAPTDPNSLTRTIVSKDFRLPYAEQFSFNVQRELVDNWALTAGWVATKGTALFQSVDGNPAIPGSRGLRRVDPTFGVIRERCNCTSSIYHSLQASLEKRLSKSFSMGAHYTYSAFIDGASEIFNPSNSGEVAVSQNSFDRKSDRGRSTYDRPQRFTVNGVYEWPFQRAQKGAVGKIVGGWQFNGFLTFQSGAAFSALNGADPGFNLSGINTLIGDATRPNVNTGLNLSTMNVASLLRAGGAGLFSPVTAASPVGNLGRNVLRADGIGNLDLGIFKNTKIAEGHTIQFRMEMYRTTNTRNFGIPEARINSANFLNQWGTDGSNRRITMGLRYFF